MLYRLSKRLLDPELPNPKPQTVRHRAINDWYGSADAFTEHVRGPLREELLKSSANFTVPVYYYALLMMPLLGCFGRILAWFEGSGMGSDDFRVFCML